MVMEVMASARVGARRGGVGERERRGVAARVGRGGRRKKTEA